MSDETLDAGMWLSMHAQEPFGYLTTTGRQSGRPHRIEIWFAVHEGRIYLMSGGRDRSDWVRNLIENPHVIFELGGDARPGVATVITPDAGEDGLARDLLVRKYATPDNPLEDWKRRSLPVVIELPETVASSPS